jgi:hypothetical protein
MIAHSRIAHGDFAPRARKKAIILVILPSWAIVKFANRRGQLLMSKSHFIGAEVIQPPPKTWLSLKKTQAWPLATPYSGVSK